ncbi:MAG: EAL domain-containing protein [Betaproteobacteria bacterium]
MFATRSPDQISANSLALRAKLSLIVVVVMAAVLLPFGWVTVRDLERTATDDAVNQVSASNQMLINMIAANQDGLRIAVSRLGTAFRHYYQGSFSLDESLSMSVGKTRAPVLKLNGKPLGLDQHSVNQFSRDTGGSVATIFVRVKDDFLRITTSLAREDGTAATGTFLGKDHPGYTKLIAGETFQGQARLFGRQYMTEYIPLLDESHRVIGLLFVGMDLTENINSLFDKIRQLQIGKTGYAFAINLGKGDGYGQFLVHPAKQGKDSLADDLGEDQRVPVREMLTQRNGVIFYQWRNEELGDRTLRQKIAAFSEYRELEWLIGTSGYIDEFVKPSRDVRNHMLLAMLAVALFAILALNLAIGRWVMTPILRLQGRLLSAGLTLRTLINALPDIVCFKDGKGRWLEANKALIDYFQLHGVDYRGKRGMELPAAQDFYHAAFLASEAADEVVWQSGQTTRQEENLPAPDGTPRIFELVRIPLFHENGRRNGMVIVGHDLSERKQTEVDQRLAARVFETTGEAIMVTDTRARIVLVNTAFCRITGYSESEILGNTPLILNSGRHDQRFYNDIWRSLLKTGTWAGEIWNRRKNGEVFPQLQTSSCVRDDSGEVTHYVAVFADLSDIRRAQEAAERLSWRDTLTGLANRALFSKRLEASLVNAHREKRFGGILLLDIKRFKDINEARGLAVGDALLRAVATKFGQILHTDDVLARLDSDEFGVLLPRLEIQRDAVGRAALAVAEKLRAALRESIAVDNETIHLEACIGIALFPLFENETAPDVLRQADTALHQAKAEGHSHAVFFESEMGDAIRARYTLENELRYAIGANQLHLYLQPQVDANSRQVGAEALVRWDHPERGLISPCTFIPLAESSDLIIAIDRWMLREVCKLLAQLEGEGQDLHISLNVSPRHFARTDFVDEIKRQLTAYAVNPARLVLEVTEGLVIGDFDDVAEKMITLKTLGLRFSMDDFGTGYSNLSYLKRLPIYELKIDKSFIDDVPSNSNDVALVETILAVARHLQLQVVAEGVETEAQADFLKVLGSIIYQGYLFGRPEPVEVWHAQLHANRHIER